MNYWSLISLFLSLLTFVFGIIVFYFDRKNHINKWFLVLCVVLAYSGFVEFMVLHTAFAEKAYFWIRAGSLWPYAFVAGLRFSFYYAEQYRALRSKALNIAVNLTFAAIAAYLFFMPRDYDVVFTSYGFSKGVSAGKPANMLISAWLIILSAVPCYVMWNYYRRVENKRKKKQSFYILLSFTLMFFAGGLIQGILPSRGIQVPFGMSIMNTLRILIIAYAVWKYGAFVFRDETAAENLIKTMNEMVFFTDESGALLKTNPVVTGILGYSERELFGTCMDGLFAGGAANRRACGGTEKDGRARGVEAIMRAKTGKEIPVLISTSPIKDKAGDILGNLYVVVDITEQKQLELDLQARMEELGALNKALHENRKDLKETNVKLVEADKMKNNFISMISHELRTPLTSIKGFLQFLLRGMAGPTTPQQREFLETIDNNTERLMALIGELLDTSRIEAGTFSVKKERGELLSVINAAIKDIFSMADVRGTKITGRTDAEKIEAEFDAYRISQVIINLLTNALKFSPRGSEISVETGILALENIKLPENTGQSVFRAGNYAVVNVKDAGSGIPPELKEKVFEKFFQIGSVDSNKPQGIGLGLPITREIMKAHGGYIWAESEGKGKGSVFTFILPV